MALITTTKGMMDSDDLKKVTDEIEDENEFTQWIEYWLDGELVHRSVHVQLKKNVICESVAAQF